MNQLDRILDFHFRFKKKVIKFFYDTNICKNRVTRAKLNTVVFPTICNNTNNFYAYDFIDGETLYKNNNSKIFSNLLIWLNDNLWKRNVFSDF